ncbi:autotransporter family porin [Pantoea ananatis]|uniref:autotransporter outer membrane beta-barrel domain-containing protein n=1 Tax=Pantoea ananas TaxID=553 RepID=UPI002781F799|nr:autotransporter outer membrane beta-barrel domain-containing protein [Pantoea ananatis]MDQ1228546.1 autotransporter family porin [Pantoea ananatis]MDR6092223.1 autotransporter family porin [Pantoea ananatis]
MSYEKKHSIWAVSLLSLNALSFSTTAASMCASAGDNEFQTITSQETEECTVSPSLGFFNVADGASVDVAREGRGFTAVYITDNNLESFGNSGTIASAYITVRVASNGPGSENETHIDDFINDGLISVKGGSGIAAVYNISGFIGDLTNNGSLQNDSLETSAELNSDLTGKDNYSTALYNLSTIDSVFNNGTIRAATGITNLTTSGITNRIGNIDNAGTITGTVANGILNEGAVGSIINESGGIIQGADTGISNAGNISQIENSGTIRGGNWSVYNSGNISGGIHNSGLLDGSVYLGNSAIYISGSRAVINGAVTGQAGSSVSVGDGSNNAAFTATNNLSVDSITVTSGSSLILTPSSHWSAANGTVNNGTLTLESGSALDGPLSQNGMLLFSTEKMASSTINASLTNRGSLVLNPTPASAGNTLTVNGDYTGLPGSSVSIGSVLAGDDSLSDRLVVTGSTSGGSTLFVTNENGGGAQTLDGIQIISVGGRSDAVFSLGNRVVAGAYDYSLRKGNVSGTDTAGWYLTSAAFATGPSSATLPATATATATEPVRMFRPEAAAYTANLQAANTLFDLSLRDHSGETRYTDPLTGENRTTSLWMRNLGGHGRTSMADGQNSTQTNRYVLQLGGDIIQGSTNGMDALHAGLMGGYGRADSSSHNGLTGRDAKGRVSGYSAGVYGTWYQNAEVKTGAWAETWAQYNWFRNEVSGDMLSAEHYSSQGIKASLETGYAWLAGSWQSGGGTENRLFLEPHAQAAWSGIRADDHTEAGGTRVQGSGNDGVTTRLGLRTYLNGKSRADQQTVREFQPFVEVNWLHNTEVYGVRMNGVTDAVRGSRNIAELKTGVEGRLSRSLTGAVVFTQQAGGGGYRDSQGSLQVSYRF